MIPRIMALRILAVAAATGRIAYVFLKGERLVDWRISDTASESEAAASKATAAWIEALQPDVVVTERTEVAVRKGEKTKLLIGAMAQVARDAALLDVAVDREQVYANKYVEASALAVQYPELQPWVPKKRRFFDNEHRNTVLFEALALAQVILLGPTPVLVRTEQ
jgi:hypothetical protein